MDTSPRCPKCSRPLAAGSPLGLCPECLLRAGFATGTQAAPAKSAPFVPPTPADLAPLFPQLEIIALIGQGGMGAVYRARQPSLDRVVALKILPPPADRAPAFEERFTREARALARLSHPNIVGVHDFGTAGDYHYFVMEFVDGVTLRHLLATAKTTPREALAIVPQICDALQFAHDRGIVHRDIKPENILIDRSGAVKIADFGLAKLVGADVAEFSITGEHDVMGTPHYMAPEQVEHPLEVDHRADIYSLGVVFYQMLTGELPLGRFAPPSRKVQIDVRLDEIVLRALEKEPELRYQQASGLKSEIATIAPGVAAIQPESQTEGLTAPAANHRPHWNVLLPLWAVAAVILWVKAGLVNQYLNTAGRLGLREAAAASTPLQQIYPGFAADAQMWVRHAIELTTGHQLQLRYTTIDNAPKGREVHWNSAWAWCIAGAGKLHQLFTGLPLPRAIERATLWLNPVVMLALIMLLSTWTARRLGTLAGAVVVVAMTCDGRMYEGFFPSYVDHHGLLAVAVFGLVLGAVVMGGGWWQRAGADAFILPASLALARRGAVFSAVSGACGMWVSAASTLPAIAIVGFSGVLALMIQGRTAQRQGAVFDAGSWRLWGRLGGGASFVFYLLEYFPGHLGLRLECNHPVHSLAWLGAGEFIAQLGERWLAPREQRWQQPSALLWPILAIAVGATIVMGGGQLFLVFDPFIAALHRDYIAEFLPLWRTLQAFDRWALLRLMLAGSVTLLAAIITLAVRRGESPIVLWFATFVMAALSAIALCQARWLLNVTGASITLILVLLTYWTISWRPVVRWALAMVVVGLLFVPEAIQRCVSAARDTAKHHVTPADAGNALSRDIAAAVRATQPQGDIVLLASPNASESIGYYGQFKTLGTLFWENIDGLKSAAAIFSARDAAEAQALMRAHGVTHVAIVSEENFIPQYYKLLHPGASEAQVRASFGCKLLFEKVIPQWLQQIPYEKPDDLKALKTQVMLFKVNFEQSMTEAIFNVARSQIAQGALDDADRTLDRVLQTDPLFHPAFVQKAEIEVARRDWETAAKHYSRALALVPETDKSALYEKAAGTFYREGQHAFAIRLYRAGLAEHANPRLAAFLAWILATSTDDALRNATEALELAQRALKSDPDSPTFLNTYAAALAEGSQFPQAIAACDRAIQNARSRGEPAAAETFEQRLSVLKTGKPLRR